MQRLFSSPYAGQVPVSRASPLRVMTHRSLSIRAGTRCRAQPFGPNDNDETKGPEVLSSATRLVETWFRELKHDASSSARQVSHVLTPRQAVRAWLTGAAAWLGGLTMVRVYGERGGQHGPVCVCRRDLIDQAPVTSHPPMQTVSAHPVMSGGTGEGHAVAGLTTVQATVPMDFIMPALTQQS